MYLFKNTFMFIQKSIGFSKLRSYIFSNIHFCSIKNQCGFNILRLFMVSKRKLCSYVPSKINLEIWIQNTAFIYVFKNKIMFIQTSNRIQYTLFKKYFQKYNFVHSNVHLNSEYFVHRCLK